MRRLLVLSLAVAFGGSAAFATDLNVSVLGQQGEEWLSEITVTEGTVVNYKVIGELSNDPNMGLALVGFDLCLPSVVLGPADVPDQPPMNNFVSDETQELYVGISNPVGECPPACGYGGTIIDGCLVQVGGGQNTIMNTPVYALYPVGSVITYVGTFGNPVVLVTGTIPDLTEGTYTLTLSNLFANVIQDSQSGDPFWTTEEITDGGTNGVLTINVCTAVNQVSAAPAHDGTLWRTEKNTIRLTFDSDLPPSAPEPGVIEIAELVQGAEGCECGPTDLSGDFTFTIEDGNILKCVENIPVLDHRTWYGICYEGGWGCVAPFEVHHLLQVGDADGNSFVTPVDVGLVNGNIGPTGTDDSRFDIDGNGFVTPVDVGLANGHISGFVPKPCD